MNSNQEKITNIRNKRRQNYHLKRLKVILFNPKNIVPTSKIFINLNIMLNLLQFLIE